MNPPPLVLASSSPRRRQLLEMLGLVVKVWPHIAEVRGADETPRDYVERLARRRPPVPGDLVLAADTAVVVDDEVLEKPADEADALRMLEQLAGRTMRSSRRSPSGPTAVSGRLPM